MPEWLVYGVDILLVAALLYQGLQLLKQAAIIRLMTGLFLLVGLYLFAATFRLQTLYWLIDNLFNSIILIAVIVFQSDIRRVLHTTTRRHSTAESAHLEALPVVDEFVNAAEILAGRRIGALIVIERQMPLDQFMVIGTDIDAKVTSELLTSIFLPYSPIHDGAVIVRHGKITKAGCFLPLSTNPDLAKELGTRHRAAIGISELADSFVIVVSEESGTISVVVDGKIMSNLDAGSLRRNLVRQIEPRWLT